MKKIFITGASGCIGHYVLDQFLNKPDYEIHLLIREPHKLKIPYKNYPQLQIHIGNLAEIETHQATISQMDYVIHIATDWSNSNYAHLLNVEKTHKLFSYCDPGRIKKIVYFSTASILGKNNQPIPEAGTLGTGYVSSKYHAYLSLKDHPLRDRIITLFPTLVFGGDNTHPYSHLSSGIIPNKNYIRWLRFFYIDAAFHFLHAADIAAIAAHVLLNPVDQNNYVLGIPSLTGKEAIQILCRAFKFPLYFQIKINMRALFWLAKLAKIEIDPWTDFCIKNPYFIYTTVTPNTFGLKTSYPNLDTVLTTLFQNFKKASPF